MCAEGLTRRRTVPICIQNNIQNKLNKWGELKKGKLQKKWDKQKWKLEHDTTNLEI